MIRTLGWILVLAAVGTVALWLMDHPGFITVEWLGYALTAPVGLLIGLLAAGLLLLLPLLLFLRGLLRLPSSIRTRLAPRRKQHELDLITDTLIALATDDGAATAQHLRRLEKQFGNVPLTHLLAAQDTYKRGKRKESITHLKSLLEHPQTRFIAARTLARLAREDRKPGEAITHAREALQLKPTDPGCIRTLFDLYLSGQRWQEAGHLIRQSRWRRRLDKPTANHYMALLHHLQSLTLDDDSDTSTALKLAGIAHKQEPGFTPATLHYADLLRKTNAKRKAINAIERGWKQDPHPALVTGLMLVCAEENAAKKLKRASALARQHPSHIESQLALAAMALEVQQWEVARNHLKAALAIEESARAYKLLARLEHQQHQNDEAAARWLARAAEAPPDATWVCDQCGHRHGAWQLHCAHCESFDSIHWHPPHTHFTPTTAPLLMAGV